MTSDDTWDLESWGWTVLSSYSSSAQDFERKLRIGPVYESPRMSRRSLRLHTNTSHYGDDSLLDSSLNHSASFSRDQTLKSRRAHHSVLGTPQIVQTPRSASTSILQAQNSTLNSCAPSNASLLSSFLDESSIQEHTLVDSFWGLDEDCDVKDQTITAHHSTVEAKTQTSTAQNGYICKDCPNASPSKNNSSLHDATGHQAPPSTASYPNTTLYCRDKNRKYKPGVLGRLSETCLHNRKRIAAFVVYICTILMQTALLKGLLSSVLQWCVRVCKGIARSTACALRKTLQSVQQKRATNGCANGGNEKYYSSMSVKEVVLQKERPKISGVLCDDCKRKHNFATDTHSSQEEKPVVTLWSLIVSTGKTASGSFLLLVDFFAKCLPMLSKVLFLVPFLLFLALCYWGLSGLLAMLPSANVMVWRGASYVTPPSTSMGDSEERQTPPDTHTQRPSVLSLSSVEAERLMRLEDNLSQLWDRVTGGLLRQEEQHTEVLSLYNTLRSELHTERLTDREGLGKWIGDLLEERFSLLKGEVQKEAKYTQQRQEKHAEESQSENTRLAEAEALLQTLARKTEELQRKQEPAFRKIPEAEAPAPDPHSEEAESSSSEDLLAEVRRLEDTLERIRDDVQGLMGCREKCEQLDSLSVSVSEQVEKEIRSLFYGSDKAEELELPESLLQWLSDHFVSTTELQASLSALESCILGNLSLQVEEGQSPSKETITQTVRQATGEAGLSEEHVQLIVNNAMKLYSEDRTGLVDYALESGGGSIISTRCSESFDTKTALLSLFGLPMWYFSQSPRVVIQPDVHPGNCWAFKGSQGYLVIGLSMKIVPTAFSLDHVPKSLSPTGNISSAPREFNVFGLDDEQQEEGQLLGQFVYDEDGDALQTFFVSEEVPRGFQIIEMKVLSNWGHPEYTCVYRFRVHGKLLDEELASS
ncbi:SUN domain-containing protein 1-like isoform X1 [Sinocyclocheilus anshuiensis]|uniref:SUN domain-containing protein 1-like isoform X1 n=1 Tax=Sinocyclocheilus anshuiensis TaxID=1608454 RepID=UPI0007B9FA9D|nr:PREDICTED: SUN domain-containing protein 1-like isoform X1 [Sinocyclocheilus anshuiensis]